MSTVEIREGAASEQVVVFRLAAERYGLDIFRVSEIVRLREITPLPHTAEHIRGLVNLRGKAIPVADLRARFGLDESTTDKARIIVVDGADGQIGLIVDEVCEVCTLEGECIAPPPAHVGDSIRGVARRHDRLIALLDLDRTLGV